MISSIFQIVFIKNSSLVLLTKLLSFKELSPIKHYIPKYIIKSKCFIVIFFNPFILLNSSFFIFYIQIDQKYIDCPIYNFSFTFGYKGIFLYPLVNPPGFLCSINQLLEIYSRYKKS